MARLQILELPKGSGDDRPPFILVIDEYQPRRYMLGIGDEGQVIDEFEGVAEKIGARQILAFVETIEIPANGPVAEAESEVSEADFTEMATVLRCTLGIDIAEGTPDLAGRLLTACRELENSEAARAHLRRERDQMRRARDERDELHAEIGLAHGQLHSAALSAIRGKHANIRELIERAEQAEAERAEARMWARHGYEIGQRHCSWSDHGVAPAWLTEGWPPRFDSCEHLKRAAEYEEALTRVRNLPIEPELMDARQEHPSVWRHGHHCGVLAAKAAARARNEEATKP
jgi:hypothetical protein